ncbi:hypothetical protein HGM15179_000495 [Zosterops borbonicus]|uniref:Reverse transcriptase n=1 Tax=Zosterops borbonicus TaxID=364589 RepID=A0A8K1LUD2_9PASS|nr:hypothetical protein HGM15179_000495 [Zosterops borbonicus]
MEWNNHTLDLPAVALDLLAGLLLLQPMMRFHFIAELRECLRASGVMSKSAKVKADLAIFYEGDLRWSESELIWKNLLIMKSIGPNEDIGYGFLEVICVNQALQAGLAYIRKIQCMLKKFTGGIKLSGVDDTLEGQDAILSYLNRLEKWAHENLIRFNKTKCKVLHLGWGNPQYQHRLGDGLIENSSGKKNLGVLVDGRLDMSQECAFAAQKAKRVLGCIQSSVGSRIREGILSLCPSLLRPHLESQHRKDTDLLE